MTAPSVNGNDIATLQTQIKQLQQDIEWLKQQQPAKTAAKVEVPYVYSITWTVPGYVWASHYSPPFVVPYACRLKKITASVTVAGTGDLEMRAYNSAGTNLVGLGYQIDAGYTYAEFPGIDQMFAIGDYLRFRINNVGDGDMENLTMMGLFERTDS